MALQSAPFHTGTRQTLPVVEIPTINNNQPHNPPHNPPHNQPLQSHYRPGPNEIAVIEAITKQMIVAYEGIIEKVKISDPRLAEFAEMLINGLINFNESLKSGTNLLDSRALHPLASYQDQHAPVSNNYYSVREVPVIAFNSGNF